MEIFSRIRRDLSLFGLALLGAGVVLWLAMRFDRLDTGLTGKLILSLLTMFGQFAWLIPISFCLIGIILMCEASEPTIIVAMSMAASSYVLLFSAIFHEGTFGHALSFFSTMCFGVMSPWVNYALLGVLTWAMSGISVKRMATGALEYASNVRVSARVTPEPIATPILSARIVRSETISDESPSSVIDAKFVDAVEPRRTHGAYHLPPLTLFNKPELRKPEGDHKEAAIEQALANFKIGVRVVETVVGPSLTQYHVAPNPGVKVDSISARANDIALAISAQSVRIEAPIPGKNVVGIEVPNAKPSLVTIREILDSVPTSQECLTVALGKDITGKPIVADIRDMPHLIVAGSTGAGKSVCLNNIIASLLVASTPDHVQMLFIDPKRVELSVYNGIPHLIRPVITDAKLAVGALQQVCRLMDDRYKIFEQSGVRKIEEYNKRFKDKKMPYIVVIIDELANLMAVAAEKAEEAICKIASLARATGIHLIVATQRPSVDVILGTIKNNIPSRIAFAVPSQADSRTILDAAGAEKLLGKGDMLFLPPDQGIPTRIQGAFITGEEVNALVRFWSDQATPDNRVEVEAVPVEEEASVDPFVKAVALFAVQQGKAAKQQIISQFRCADPKASRAINDLERLGIVGPQVGKKPREVLVGHEQIEELLNAA